MSRPKGVCSVMAGTRPGNVSVYEIFAIIVIFDNDHCHFCVNFAAF